MARPIRETPILYGKDAERFVEEMKRVESLTPEQRKANREKLQAEIAILDKEWNLTYNAFFLIFCRWLKNGLKAQKLLAQGSTLGTLAVSIAPCKGKSFKKSSTYNIFPSSDTRNRILAPPHFTGSLELKY